MSAPAAIRSGFVAVIRRLRSVSLGGSVAGSLFMPVLTVPGQIAAASYARVKE
jgi:hypothetical protein